MDRVMTPQEWACKGEKPPTDVLLNSESVLEYAKYYHSKQPKKDIILPEYKLESVKTKVFEFCKFHWYLPPMSSYPVITKPTLIDALNIGFENFKIILPEYELIDEERLKFDPEEHEKVKWNAAIDEVKRLNGIQ